MTVANKFNSFPENLAEAVHNLASNSLKLALTNTAPVATQTSFDPTTNHPAPASANGYPSGGVALVVGASSSAGGIYKLTLNVAEIIAAGGTLGPFRYAILYNDTPETPSKPLICWYDLGAEKTLRNEEELRITFDAVEGVLQIA